MKVVCYSLPWTEEIERENMHSQYKYINHIHIHIFLFAISFNRSHSLSSSLTSVMQWYFRFFLSFASTDNWRLRSVKKLFVFWSSSSSMNFIAFHKKWWVCLLIEWESKRTEKNMMKNKWWTQKRKKKKNEINLQISNIHSENVDINHFGQGQGRARMMVYALHIAWEQSSKKKTEKIYIINFYVCLLAKFKYFIYNTHTRNMSPLKNGKQRRMSMSMQWAIWTWERSRFSLVSKCIYLLVLMKSLMTVFTNDTLILVCKQLRLKTQTIGEYRVKKEYGANER